MPGYKGEKAVRFMIQVRANKDMEAGLFPPNAKEMFEAMDRFNQELVRDGWMLAGDGLHPSSRGKRMRFANGKKEVIDGPFAETKELIAGYTLIQVKSREEAMEWSRRFPNPAGAGQPAEIELRPLFELEDFAPGEGVERFRRLDAERAQAGGRP